MAKTALKGGGPLRHARRVAWRKVAEEAVILDTDTAHYFSLAGTGLRAWELFAHGRSPSQVAAALCDEYDAPPAAIAADVGELAAALRKEGLLEPA
ncbi:MAG: PqqD family protein [Elusimicrobia bacterium]|nr:PqqD family protein [Elusimicrobiota bacterium]